MSGGTVDTLHAAWQFIAAHDLIAAWILAVMIDKLPAATAASGPFYRWFFAVAQVLAANWERGKRGVQGTLSAPPQ